MKKNAVIAGIMMVAVAAVSFAEDPKLVVRARMKANLATVYTEGDAKDSGMSVPGDDRFGVEYKQENAGATVLLKGKLIDGTVELYDYFGWMKFGALKITGGEWDHYKADIVDKDASNFGGLWDLYYGALAFDATKEGFLKAKTESDNITPWKSEFAGDYALGDATVSFSTGNNTKDPYNVADFFGARVSYKMGDSGVGTGTFVMNGKDLATVGLFANVLTVENLNLVVGYSGYHDLKVSDNTLNAVELRARYAMDRISLTTHNNATFGKDSMILYDMVNASYKIDDRFTASFLVANTNVSGDLAANKGNYLTVRPGLTVTAQKGASIDGGVRAEMAKPDVGQSFTRISVPVIFRVKL